MPGVGCRLSPDPALVALAGASPPPPCRRRSHRRLTPSQSATVWGSAPTSRTVPAPTIPTLASQNTPNPLMHPPQGLDCLTCATFAQQVRDDNHDSHGRGDYEWGWFSRCGHFTRFGQIPGGGRPLLREVGPISYEATPSAFSQPNHPPPPPPPGSGPPVAGGRGGTTSYARKSFNDFDLKAKATIQP